ncbi:hypothetical protein KC19_11G173600 [Ceratodon purpureus]|uniref:Uncharacterized protein n=1 Tax=Ceratodon purpureus TaxID=3225 RepID=A0A8T0GIC4_CERPU|nr:hypothetical protein KC19_11G173600 [Ceratodon purpureus]
MGSIVVSVLKWDNMLAILFAMALGYLSSRLLPQMIASFQVKLSAILQGRGLYSTLQGKHVVVTGGSSGIGYTIAEYALREGASVTLIARNVDKLQKAKASLIQETNCLSGAVHVTSADVSDATAVTAAIRDAQEWMPIDILVCNAGVVFVGRLDEIPVSQLEDAVRANVLGSVYPIHATIPLMKSRCTSNTPQSIVLVSSVAGLHQAYASNVYSSTKYAQRGLAETLRWELLPFNIHMHVVCPGYVDTPMLHGGLEAAASIYAGKTEAYKKINFLDPKNVVSASHVAKCTWEGVKRGRFLITSDWIGYLFAVISRGPIPEESIVSNIYELLLIIPVRLLSFVLKRIMTRKILRLKL